MMAAWLRALAVGLVSSAPGLTRPRHACAPRATPQLLFGLGQAPPPQADITTTAFLDVVILSPAGDTKYPVGRLELGLFGNATPKCTERFLALCQRADGPASLIGNPFHRCIKGFIVQAGELPDAGLAAFEEANDLKHLEGSLSMSNDGGQSTTEFFVTLRQAPELDGQFTVFGQVTGGMKEVVRDMDRRSGSSDGVPWCTYQITRCGVLD